MRGKGRVLRGAVTTRGVLADALIFAAVGAMACLHAWAHIEGTRAGYELSTAQSEQHDLLRENRAIELELATRRSARRIEASARALGMVDPDPASIFAVDAAVLPSGAQASR